MSGVHEETTSGADAWSASAPDSTSPPPEERGSTSIPASVVARIAEQAATEVAHIGSSAGGVLGVGARRDFDSRPSVHCDLYGRTAVLRLDVGISFPAPLAEVLAALREHVRSTVTGLTGLEVGRMDVEVSWLNPETSARRTLR